MQIPAVRLFLESRFGSQLVVVVVVVGLIWYLKILLCFETATKYLYPAYFFLY